MAGPTDLDGFVGRQVLLHTSYPENGVLRGHLQDYEAVPDPGEGTYSTPVWLMLGNADGDTTLVNWQHVVFMQEAR